MNFFLKIKPIKIASCWKKSTDPKEESVTEDSKEEPITEDSNRALSLRAVKKTLSPRNLPVYQSLKN